jgi:hypothetical protein
MAATITRTARWHAGGYTHGIYSFTFDDSYPTDGEDFSPISDEFREVLSVKQVANDGDPNQFVTWTSATDKLKLWLEDNTSGIYAEAGSTSDQSAIVVILEVTGR